MAVFDRVQEVPLRGITRPGRGRVALFRTLDRGGKTLNRTECTLKRERREKMPRCSTSSFPPCFTDTLSQVTTMDEAVDSARRGRARTRVSVPRCHTPPAPAAQPFVATLGDTDYAGRLKVATAAFGMLDRVT